MTHAELCDLFGLARTSPAPHWLPYAVQCTRVEIVVDGRRVSNYGGAMQCGSCGYGVDIRPGHGAIGPNGPTTAADLLRCPKCGWDGVAAVRAPGEPHA